MVANGGMILDFYIYVAYAGSLLVPINGSVFMFPRSYCLLSGLWYMLLYSVVNSLIYSENLPQRQRSRDIRDQSR